MRNYKLLWVVLLVLVLAGGIFGVAQVMAGPKQAVPVSEIASSAMENKFGVRFTQLALTAEGGLVDIRFTVIDPDKAHEMMINTATLPVVLVNDKTEVATNATMNHKAAMEVGRTYWFLYYNAGGALKPGMAVTLKVGDVRLENVLVQ